MPDSILLLRLEGPLQSWGVRSRWSRRDTGPEPSKSAIIGLLGCAAGILRRDWHASTKPERDLELWDQCLCFGVRMDRPGTIETDYHTVQGHFQQADGKIKTASHISGTSQRTAERDLPHTEVTWRDYLHDAAFLVALALRPEQTADAGLLDNLAKSLLNPKWPLYLGRKCCVPSRPVFERLTEEGEYQDLESALRNEPWSAPLSPKQRKEMEREPLIAWIETPDGEYERQDAMRLNQLRFYDFRRCKRIEIPIPEESLEGRPVA